MKRLMVYPGAIPLETDLLSIQRNTLISLSKLSEVLFGTGSTVLYGLGCTATSPASLQIDIAPGQIYMSDSIDASAFSSLAADTDHTLLKQGLLLDKLTLNCPAPVTVGFSINYLVQVTFQEIDATPVVLPYYNASNPAVAYTGPNNSGGAQNTTRTGQCAVAIKAGVSATTGTQVTPTPDARYIGIWVVSVAYGQTVITSDNILQVSNAPFFIAPMNTGTRTVTATATYLITNNDGVLFCDTSAGSYTVTLPVIAGLVSGKRFTIKNTTPPATANTLSVVAADGKTIDLALQIDVSGREIITVCFDGSNWETI